MSTHPTPTVPNPRGLDRQPLDPVADSTAIGGLPESEFRAVRMSNRAALHAILEASKRLDLDAPSDVASTRLGTLYPSALTIQVCAGRIGSWCHNLRCFLGDIAAHVEVDLMHLRRRLPRELGADPIPSYVRCLLESLSEDALIRFLYVALQVVDDISNVAMARWRMDILRRQSSARFASPSDIFAN